MSVLTSGRSEPCKDSAGGIKEIWLAPYVKYDPASIVGYREALISSFPPTLMFEFQGNEMEFTEDIDGDSWKQRASLSMAKLVYTDSITMIDVMNVRVRAVIVDHLGKIQVLGLHNGLDVEVTTTTGGALDDFSGYRMNLEGLEPYPAPFLAAFPGGGTLPGSGFAKSPGYTTECYLASSDLPSSTSETPASCQILVSA